MTYHSLTVGHDFENLSSPSVITKCTLTKSYTYMFTANYYQIYTNHVCYNNKNIYEHVTIIFMSMFTPGSGHHQPIRWHAGNLGR